MRGADWARRGEMHHLGGVPARDGPFAYLTDRGSFNDHPARQLSSSFIKTTTKMVIVEPQISYAAIALLSISFVLGSLVQTSLFPHYYLICLLPHTVSCFLLFHRFPVASIQVAQGSEAMQLL